MVLPERSRARWKEGVYKPAPLHRVLPSLHANRGRPSALDKEQQMKILVLRLFGLPIRDIAERFGVSRMAVWRSLHVLNYQS
ncbi:helix-turn-helix domain-containing protein [archaeon]|nr:helix-turn-helix domain-containing protein [archaeon]